MRNASGNQEESSNALPKHIVPSSHTLASNLLKSSRIPKHAPTNLPKMDFHINMMGNITDYNFYIPDEAGDSTGLSFRAAYYAARNYGFGDHKNLCTCVGSMLCSVVPAFRNSVEAALNGSGIRPRFMSLPSQAQEYRKTIPIAEVPESDWPSILVVFGYCVLILFKMDSEIFGRGTYVTNSPHTNRIDELRTKVGCHRNYLSGIPFKPQTENSIRTVLGTHALRNSVINFLMRNFNHSDPQICSLCHYLSYVLSWSGDMRVFTVLNERLVKTKSPVLSDLRVVPEVENLEELIKAIASYTYPQYFNHTCLVSELFYLDVSRFPTLFTVVLELEKEGDIGYAQFCEGISKVDSTTVRDLVKLHRTAMTENRVTTFRCLPTVPGI